MTDTAEILAAVRTALACDPDEDVVVAARIAKEQAAREPMVVGLMRILDVLGWDEAGGVEPIEHARRVVADRETLAASLIEMRARAEKAETERTVRDQVIADFRAGLAEVEIKWSADTARANAAEAERDAARRDLAEERGAAIAAEARAGQAALDLVAERHRHATEIESLKAGLRALAGIRDEGAAETHRWRNRALVAESAAERERAKNDELFAKMEAGAKGAALKEEAEGDQAGLKRLAEAARDVRSALQAAGVDTSEMTPDQLAGVVAEKLDDLAAADELEKAVRRHLPVADGYEDSDSPLRMVESAGSTIEFTAKQIRAAWDALDTKATPSPVPYPGALRSGEGLADAIRAQLAALRGERDDLVVQLGAKTREVEDARRDLADEALAQLQARTDCGSSTGCGECVGCMRQSVADTHQAARLAHDDLTDRIAKLDAEVAHLKAKRATSDAERDAARETLQRVVALCQAELEHVPSMLSTATRSLAWVLLREVSPETVHRLHAQDMATAQNVWPASGSIEFFVSGPLPDDAEVKAADGYPPSGAPDPEPVAKPVEAPQATETQPDPGEGWRLLGPLEVIEEGDEWRFSSEKEWKAEKSRSVLGGTVAREHSRYLHVIGAILLYRRRLVAPTPAPEPRFEHVVEERGTRFIIVRREVTT